jgi:ABC-2 type transport system ATP-binding protein
LEGVTRRFGGKTALDNVSLTIPKGVVLGLVGANGAGKTTLIKHILGLLRAQTGSVRVLGVDPSKHPVEVLSRLGYLSEDRDLPPWMSVAELLRYSRAFRQSWDDAYAEELRNKFQLSATAQVRNLSKGELAKAGLIVALAHKPDLLVLDEPSSGLDPIVRREMLEAVVRSVADQGRTVLFSSHLLDEIVRVSDHVAMMAQGHILIRGPLNEVLESHRRMVIRLKTEPAGLPNLPGALSIAGGPDEWTVICNGDRGRLAAYLNGMGGDIVEESEASFEEIFQARVNRQTAA